MQLRLDALRGRLHRIFVRYRSAVDRPTFVTTQPLPCTAQNPATSDPNDPATASSTDSLQHQRAYTMFLLTCFGGLRLYLGWLSSQAMTPPAARTALHRRAASRRRLGLCCIVLLLLGFGWGGCYYRGVLCHGHKPDHTFRLWPLRSRSISGHSLVAVYHKLQVRWWHRPLILLTLCSSLACHPLPLASGLGRSGLCIPFLVTAMLAVLLSQVEHGSRTCNWHPSSSQAHDADLRSRPPLSQSSTMSGPKSGRYCTAQRVCPRFLLCLIYLWANLHAVTGVRVGAAASQQAPGVSSQQQQQCTTLEGTKHGTHFDAKPNTWHSVRKRAFSRAIIRARRSSEGRALYRGRWIAASDDLKDRANQLTT